MSPFFKINKNIFHKQIIILSKTHEVSLILVFEKGLKLPVLDEQLKHAVNAPEAT